MLLPFGGDRVGDGGGGKYVACVTIHFLRYKKEGGEDEKSNNCTATTTKHLHKMWRKDGREKCVSSQQSKRKAKIFFSKSAPLFPYNNSKSPSSGGGDNTFLFSPCDLAEYPPPLSPEGKTWRRSAEKRAQLFFYFLCRLLYLGKMLCRRRRSCPSN